MKLAFSRWFFNQILSRHLIYNQCWEDPAIDNEVLDVRSGDRLVMITSAGCNALDYLLHGPALIQCVDVNPQQNALLELKIAAIETLSYEQFFEMFGTGRIRDNRRIYRELLRARLSESARRIWDRRIGYFDTNGVGLYFHGAAGFFARCMHFYLNNWCGLRSELRDFQKISNLQQQATFYRLYIAPKLWSPMIRYLMRRPEVLSILGVPEEQIAQMKREGADVSSSIEEMVEQTLTTIPICENYFWRVYLNGYYPANCFPNYLKRENFGILQQRVSRIQIQTTTLTSYLQSSPQLSSNCFDIFVLLDHMDWLSAAPELLDEEWRFILNSASPDARILYRSGSKTCDFIPGFAANRLQLHPWVTEYLNTRDRVGTYASFHFAKVTS
jgi:S-adenosylmethionine-diacylglycerol 3-amino-3-carboxypropyl transferase